MRNVIFDLYDESNQYIVERIIEKRIYNVLGVIATAQYTGDSKLCNQIDDFSKNDYVNDVYDSCIILNNTNIQPQVAFELAERYIKNSKSIESYYPFSESDINRLKKIAKENNVVFEQIASFYECNHNAGRQIDIPVVYIAGLHRDCDIFASHLLMDSMLTEQGYRTINITNSEYASMYDYIPMHSLYTPLAFNLSVDMDSIRNKIVSAVNQVNADVLIVSNLDNFVNLQDRVINYGFDNYILNNVFDFDYVFYNVPANMLIYDSEKTMCFLMNELSQKTNNAEVFIGVSHVVLDKYFDSSYYFVRMRNDEYSNCLKMCKFMYENVVDPLSLYDISNRIFNDSQMKQE